MESIAFPKGSEVPLIVPMPLMRADNILLRIDCFLLYDTIMT